MTEADSAPAPEDAHPSLSLDRPDRARVEQVWRDYWLPLLREDGTVSIERLKGELYDAYHLVNEARKVYRHITGGVTDDLTASAEGIIAMAERVTERRLEGLQAKLADAEARARQAERQLEELRCA